MNPIIHALDHDNHVDALKSVKRLCGVVGAFKIGMELYHVQGPAIVHDVANLLRSEGSPSAIMLDLKLHDIPTTVERTVKAFGKYLSGAPVRFLTVHASGGREMLRAAVEAAAPFDVGILAVTVLTSMSAKDLIELGVDATEYSDADLVRAQVERLATIAFDTGCAGIVCAPTDVAHLRAMVPRHLQDRVAYVCPGIRPAGAEMHDQARVDTPGAAIRAGATHLVVGRPIRDATDPVEAAKVILSEIESALGDYR